MRACVFQIAVICLSTVSVWAEGQEADLQTIHELRTPINLDEVKPEHRDRVQKAYDAGREQAISDWDNGEAKIIAMEGGYHASGFDVRTGLDIEYRGACRWTTEMIASIDGYNAYLVEQLQEHGLPENNRLRWADDIVNPKRAIDAGEDVDPLTVLGDPVPGPDNTTLQWRIEEDHRSYFYLLDAEGKTLHKVFMGVSSFQKEIKIAWGPPGSHVLFMQVLEPYVKNSYYRYYAIDFRTDRRLFSELGPEMPPVDETSE